MTNAEALERQPICSRSPAAPSSRAVGRAAALRWPKALVMRRVVSIGGGGSEAALLVLATLSAASAVITNPLNASAEACEALRPMPPAPIPIPPASGLSESAVGPESVCVFSSSRCSEAAPTAEGARLCRLGLRERAFGLPPPPAPMRCGRTADNEGCAAMEANGGDAPMPIPAALEAFE